MPKSLDYKVVLEAQNNAQKAFDDLNKAIAKLTAGTETAQSRVEKLAKKMNSMGERAKKIGKKMSSGLTTPIMALGAMAVKKSAEIETISVSLESMLGSADKAEKTENFAGKSD